MTPAQQAIYDCFERDRDALPLPQGMRYLTPDDYWQIGDEYKGGDWWKIGSDKTLIHEGDRVNPMFLCYIPRGVINRKKT